MSPGTYKITCGSIFYYGSSFDVVKRRRDHEWRLKNGIHPNAKLQAAFNESGTIEFDKTYELAREKGETPQQHRDRLRAFEQEGIDMFNGNPNFANKSMNSRGPDSREDVAKRWEDPEYRARMSQKAKERLANNPVSQETRDKMAASKRGARNHSARAVIATNRLTGESHEFPSISDAAKFFKVTQQLFDSWIRGTVAWPGTGRYCRRQHEWIMPYQASFK